MFDKKYIKTISLLLIFCLGLTSCEQITKTFENKLNYEAEEVFNIKKLGFENLMFCQKSIDFDDNYIYCITSDDDYYQTGHGILVRTDADGSDIATVEICEAARKKGYTECYAYELRSIDVYDDVIIIAGEESLLFPRYTELICLDKSSLQILWHWHSAPGGWFFKSSTAKWNDNYIFTYMDKESGSIAWLTIIDHEGNELVTKQIGSCGWADEGVPLIVDDMLIVRTSEYAYEAYNLNLLLDNSLTSDDCIISRPETKNSYYSTTGIVTNNKGFYTHSSYKDTLENTEERFMECYAKDTFELIWKSKLQTNFSTVSALPNFNGKYLYVPADYGCLYCFDANIGKQIWCTDIRKKQNENFNVNLLSSPTIVEDRWLCITCNSTQELLVLDSRNGEIMARINVVVTPTAIQSFSKDGYLYLAGANSLYRFRFWEK